MSGAMLTMDLAMASDPDRSGSQERGIEHVTVDGKHVRVDVFGNDPQRPTVLLLHGAAGMLGDGGLMRRAARALAAGGLRAAIPHYFNVTSTLFATPGNVREHGRTWFAAINGIARHFAQVSDGIGVLGHAMGGSLAIGAGFDVPEVAAVAVMNAGLAECQLDVEPRHTPPLLILHGADDTWVPPARAEAMERLARQSHGFVDMVMYPGEGHSFGARTEGDALHRVCEFFHARLGAGVYR